MQANAQAEMQFKVTVGAGLQVSQDEILQLHANAFKTGNFDHELNFRAPDGSVHRLAELRIVADRNGSQKIWQAQNPPDERIVPIAVSLVSDAGLAFDQLECTSAIGAAWHYGVVMRDAGGQAWFYGRNEVTSGELGTDEPILRKVNGALPAHMLTEHGDLFEMSSAWEGEFWLTEEAEPTLTSAPWLSTIGGAQDVRGTEILTHIHMRLFEIGSAATMDEERIEPEIS